MYVYEYIYVYHVVIVRIANFTVMRIQREISCLSCHRKQTSFRPRGREFTARNVVESVYLNLKWQLQDHVWDIHMRLSDLSIFQTRAMVRSVRFSYAWDLHMCEISICVKSRCVWHFRIREIFMLDIFNCVTHSNVWNRHTYIKLNFHVWKFHRCQIVLDELFTCVRYTNVSDVQTCDILIRERLSYVEDRLKCEMFIGGIFS